MKRFSITAITGLVALVLVFPGVASGFVGSLFDATGDIINVVKYSNYEIILVRVAEDEGEFNLADESGTVHGYIEFNPLDTSRDLSTAEKIAQFEAAAANAYVAQILKATSVQHFDPVASTSTTVTISGGELTAYAVSQIATFSMDTALWDGTAADFDDIQVDMTFKKADLDPFGVLNISAVGGKDGLGAMMYWDTSEDFSFNGGSVNPGTKVDELKEDVKNATDGTSFVGVGYGAAIDTPGAPGTASLSADGGIFNPDVQGGMNLLTNTGFEYLKFPGVVNEDNQTLTSFSLRSGIDPNESHVDNDGSSYWRLESDDPWKFKMTPEPGSAVALAGLLVMGAIGFLYRRVRKS